MYCMACGKEYENEMFCPECGRMLVSAHTFDYQEKESYKNYIEEELKAEKERIRTIRAKHTQMSYLWFN